MGHSRCQEGRPNRSVGRACKEAQRARSGGGIFCSRGGRRVASLSFLSRWMQLGIDSQCIRSGGRGAVAGPSLSVAPTASVARERCSRMLPENAIAAGRKGCPQEVLLMFRLSLNHGFVRTTAGNALMTLDFLVRPAPRTRRLWRGVSCWPTSLMLQIAGLELAEWRTCAIKGQS